jgi:exodeoxyribonuclease V alpha subunit
LKIVRAKKMRVMLAAPTGRAAKRLTETTGYQAKTIHRLLEYTPQNQSFKHNAYNPLAVDFLVIDEASMLDVPLMYHLILALPLTAACVFVGDVDQLPSVGPGAVLRNLIDSQTLATVFLSEIFRQQKASHIVLNAHRIHQGHMPENIPPLQGNLVDFYWIPLEALDDIQKTVIELVSTRIPRRFGLDAMRDIQVLTPMHRSSLGAHTLNTLLQQRLNTHTSLKCQSFGQTFIQGDKVIQLRNNYDKEVFNGDLGIIQSIDTTQEIVQIQFDHRVIAYEMSELNEINLAYALSIHKSQGSEYPAVVIPMTTQHYIMLARNLLYTAVTRGKQLVVLVGHKKAVQIAVQAANVEKRITKLKEWMNL